MRLALAVLMVAPLAAARGQTCSAPIPAGSCTASTTTTLTTGTVLQLTLGSVVTTLTAPGTADYDAGLVADNGPVTTVKANRPWSLQFAAAAGTWSATNTQAGVTARLNKPASDLQWGSAAAGPFASMTMGGTTAASGNATAGTTKSFYFRTLYSWTADTPGAYSLALVFTLTAP